jgi:hypothetical protein
MEKTKAVFDKFGVQEFYTLVAAVDPQPSRQMTDLFEGM